jgi:hypothetical protein
VRVLTARTAGRLAAEHGLRAYFDLEAGESVSVLGDTVWS